MPVKCSIALHLDGQHTRNDVDGATRTKAHHQMRCELSKLRLCAVGHDRREAARTGQGQQLPFGHHVSFQYPVRGPEGLCSKTLSLCSVPPLSGKLKTMAPL